MVESSGIVNSIIKDRNRNCMGCRIFSGCGLMGFGLHAWHQSQKLQNNYRKTLLFTIGNALILLGTARVFDLPPFSKFYDPEMKQNRH